MVMVNIHLKIQTKEMDKPNMPMKNCFDFYVHVIEQLHLSFFMKAKSTLWCSNE